MLGYVELWGPDDTCVVAVIAVALAKAKEDVAAKRQAPSRVGRTRGTQVLGHGISCCNELLL
jgi:2-methylcitrate dehydratase PrpD